MMTSRQSGSGIRLKPVYIQIQIQSRAGGLNESLMNHGGGEFLCNIVVHCPLVVLVTTKPVAVNTLHLVASATYLVP